jgi:ribose/xylose/arabinose/galactoside ABC-type transport system permease subunit
MTDGAARSWVAQWVIPLAMFAAVLALALTAPGFATPQNLRNIGTQIPVNLILAAGMTLVILTGGVDLSVGSLHALCGITAGLVITHPELTTRLGGWTVPAAILAALLLGAGMGAFNGGAIAWVGIPPFIVTLAMMRIARGIALHVTNGTPFGIVGPEVPQWREINAHWLDLRPLGLGYLGDTIPISFLLAVAVVTLLALLLRLTQPGRYIYAVGSSEGAARLAGVPVARVKLLVYTLMGLLAGLSGVVEAAMLQSGSPKTGEGYELNAIAAVVVGGTRLSGGQGGVLGTFVGAVFVIGLMNNALNLYGVPSFWQEAASGAIIFGVALVDRFTRTER